MRIHVGDFHHDGMGHWVVKKIIENEDGGLEDGVFVFPEDALEWRAAEYGIDPADTDTLFDIVIAEFFLLPEDSDGPGLYETGDAEEARAAHLRRIARAKLRHRISTRGKAHPSAELKRKFLMDLEAVDIKSKIVAKRRNRIAEQNAAASLVQQQPHDRLYDLRRTLEGS